MTTPEPLHEWDIVSMDNPGFHAAADIFPSMSEDEFQAFKQDIAEHGLQVPIVTLPSGQIIDGRHRWRACMETKTTPRYQVHDGNPWVYVISANLHRRHLSVSQRSMVVARIADRPRGQPGQSNPRNRGLDPKQLPPTQQHAARLLNVGMSAVTDARRVVKGGVPELQAAVDSGEVSVNVAARMVATDEDTQRKFVERVKSGEKATHVAPEMQAQHKQHQPIKRIDKHPAMTVFNKTHAANLSSGLAGIELAFRDMTRVDKGVTPDMAKDLRAQISTTKTVLNRLARLLQEREG